MPYIKPKERNSTSLIEYNEVGEVVSISLEKLGIAVGETAENAGEFNFLISTAISRYLEVNGLNYENCNEIVGMLECCKQEFVRRVVAPYEDMKLEDNGDCGYDDVLDSKGLSQIVDLDNLIF